ncbi:MAG TPA: SagB/ThcOx family dehydrogenase [Burkholderiaceae bacterium]|nr:SagB/ThcOx family dehydrogenase [Burkholderiaceae bacterium]
MSEMTLSHALSQRETIREFSDQPIPLQTLKELIWAGQGITRPDGRRTAPSAHAIHPLRLFIQANKVTGLEKGLYKVDPSGSDLVRVGGPDRQSALIKAAIGNPRWMADAACIIAVCADMVTPSQAFADQRPFGTRGTRYVYLEAGASAQNMQLQATAENLGSVWVGGFDDEATADALGLHAPLAPIIQLCVGYPV